MMTFYSHDKGVSYKDQVINNTSGSHYNNFGQLAKVCKVCSSHSSHKMSYTAHHLHHISSHGVLLILINL